MKQFSFVILLIICAYNLTAQIISFEDPAFKNALVSTNCVDIDGDSEPDLDADTNDDGEIDVNEASSINSIILSYKNISSIKEISYFSNLQNLYCRNNNLTEIDVYNLPNLLYLHLEYNRISKINYNPVNSITSIDISHNEFENIDNLEGLPLYFNISDNNIKKINISNAQKRLESLIFSNNPIDTFILNSQTTLNKIFSNKKFYIYDSKPQHLRQTKINIYKSNNGFEISEIENFDIINFDSTDIENLIIKNSHSLKNLTMYLDDINNISLADLDSLEYLELYNTKADKISFQNLLNLPIIGINNIKVDSVTVNYLPRCKEIYIVQCGLNEFNIQKMDSLDVLNLSLNNLRTLKLEGAKNLKDLYCADNKLSNINFNESIETFNLDNNNFEFIEFSKAPNLKWVSCTYNKLTSLDISPLNKIEHLSCNNNKIENINFGLHQNLTSVICDSNFIAEIDFSKIPKLTSIFANSNHIKKLEIKNHSYLQYFFLDNNYISEVNLENLDSLIWLSLQNNKIASIDISNLKSLEVLDLDENQLTTFTAPPMQNMWALDMNNNNRLKQLDLSKLKKLRYLECSENDSLQFVNIKNGSIEDNGLFEFDTLIFNNNPKLTSICCDNEQIAHVKSVSLNSNPNVEVNDNCYDGDVNIIKITAYLDRDNNRIFTSDYDVLLPNVQVDVAGLNSTYFTDKAGKIIFTTNRADLEFSARVNYGNWEQNETYWYSIITDSITDIYLPFQSLDDNLDPELSLNIGYVRCNKPTNISINALNVSSNLLTSQIIFQYDKRINILSSNHPYDRVDDSTIVWRANDITIYNNFGVNLIAEIPTATSNEDSLDFNFIFKSSSGDIIDNINRNELIKCSYDPNDKRSWPDRIGEDNYTLRDEVLNYQIRFQNTGNDTAYIVKITDGLDKNLNVRSLKILNSSHAVVASFLNDSLTFIFENINLVDSLTDPIGSQGFVNFTIEPFPNIPEETIIFNTVNIYFDLNSPIVTNTVKNTIVNKLPCPLGGIWIENNTLNVNQDQDKYLWFDCKTDTLIIETSIPQFEPTLNGEYYCIIKGHFCDTKTNCINLISSLDNPDNNIHISIFPNPSNGNFDIKSDMLFSKIEILNNFGQQVFLQEILSTYNHSLNIPLPSGLYMIRLTGKNDKKVHTKMIIR